MKRRSLLAIALIGLAGRDAHAQADTGAAITIGRTFRFDSKTLAESRSIAVTLPRGYETRVDRRYPLLVVLDGESEHELAAALTRFYVGASQLPDMIVVGIRNTDRMRDFTTPPVAGFRAPPEARTAGGADRFLDFLGDELLPHLDRVYRTAPLRVLVGHSLGGLLALHALAKRPELFTGYLVMEPSIWWNDQREFDAARAALALPAARRARLMMVNTQHLGVDTTHWGGLKPMVRHLSTTGETHQSMAAPGMIQGLRQIFADFLPAEWRPGTRPIAMLERVDSLAARIGYAPPVSDQTFIKVFQMSVNSRHFDDADQVLERMERSLGASSDSRALRDELSQARKTKAPDGFIPLEVPARRPRATEASRFLGRWTIIGDGPRHDVEIKASGDTIVVHDRVAFPNGPSYEGDDPVIQLTSDGTLEWGLPFFRGIAALLVLQARLQEDGTMIVRRQVRGWVPVGPGLDLTRVDRFRRS